ncbi:MAG: hypothetical protein JW720_12075 [Sedimentisphaerales bacterium]|nr:hypothetical protein [Sedimentisphaerales bacterium]
MIKHILTIGVIMAVLLSGNSAWCEECGIVNPSFEDDLPYIENILSDAPTGWTVSAPDGRFSGDVKTYTSTGWSSDGLLSLSLHTNKAQFYAGDMITISQEVDFADLTRIVFDVRLKTVSDIIEWDESQCSAMMMIDGDVVWDSNSVGGVKGIYLDQVYVIDRKYKTGGPKVLSLGMRMNEDWRFYVNEFYTSQWDMIDCNLCPGAGVVDGDLDGNCCVDGNDLKVLADLWLVDEVEPNNAVNLSHVDDELDSYATIDFHDFSVYAGNWPGDMNGVAEISASWLGLVDPDYEYNLYHEDDIRPRGIINFFDVAILAENWLKCGAEE